jgi:hypothetical protein
MSDASIARTVKTITNARDGRHARRGTAATASCGWRTVDRDDIDSMNGSS